MSFENNKLLIPVFIEKYLTPAGTFIYRQLEQTKKEFEKFVLTSSKTENVNKFPFVRIYGKKKNILELYIIKFYEKVLRDRIAFNYHKILSPTQFKYFETDGALTVVDTSTGSVEVLSNALKSVGATSWDATGGYSGAITKALGTTLIFDTASAADTTNQKSGLFSTASMNNADRVYNMHYQNTGVGRFQSNPSGINSQVFTYVAGTSYTTALVMGGYDSGGVPYKIGDTKANFTYGCNLYIKGGIFTNWTLLYKESSGTTTPLYAGINNYDATLTTDNLRIPDADLSSVLQPTDRLDNPSSSTAFTSTADGLIRFKITTMPSSGNIDIDLRRQDASNYWRIRVTSAGAVQLLDDLGNVRATATGTAAANSVVDLIYYGTNGDLFLNGAGKASYSSMDLLTETSGQVTSLGTGGAILFVSSNPRTSTTQYDDVFDLY